MKPEFSCVHHGLVIRAVAYGVIERAGRPVDGCEECVSAWESGRLAAGAAWREPGAERRRRTPTVALV